MMPNNLRLNCLVLDADATTRRIFPIDIAPTETVAMLRKAIQAEKQNTFQHVDVDALMLWKVSIPVDKEFAATISKLRRDLDDNESLLPMNELSDKFSDITKGVLHVVVRIASGHLRKLPEIEPPYRAYDRPETIKALYHQVSSNGIVLVKGTPGSGKTTIAYLLCHYILQTNPDAWVHLFGSWETSESLNSTDLDTRLDRMLLWPKPPFFRHKPHTMARLARDHPIFMIFDDGADTYWDHVLWTWLKSIQGVERGSVSAVFFVSYGSHSDQNRSPTSDTFPVRGTLFAIPAPQRVGLRRTDDVHHSLNYRREEFSAYIDYIWSRNQPDKIEKQLIDSLYATTDGHCGALEAYLQIINTEMKAREIRQRGNGYTLDDFNRLMVNPIRFWNRLKAGEHAFTRGLPGERFYKILRQPGIFAILSALLSRELQIPQDSTFPYSDAIHRLNSLGWVNLQEVVVNSGSKDCEFFKATFASPVHRFYFSVLLRPPQPPSLDMDLREFAKTCITFFSPKMLSSQTLYRASVPEALYQEEFFRTAFELSDGYILISPELYTDDGRGRIDFLIPEKSWGIELLRDGRNVRGHVRRFGPTGAYHAWIQNNSIQHYLVLDFRSTVPSVKVADSNLVYVVFLDTSYNSFTLYDNHCREIKNATRVPITGGYPEVARLLIEDLK